MQPLEGARELVASLKGDGWEVVLALELDPEALRPLHRADRDRDELADGWTTKDDVEASKPEPDLVHAALEKANAEQAVMVGDTPWDVEAARRAGVETVCVLTGGFSEQELARRRRGRRRRAEHLPDAVGTSYAVRCSGGGSSVGRARVVVPVVAGSSPVRHPQQRR